MNIETLRTDIAVLLLYNVDPSWPADDVCHAQTLAEEAPAELCDIGHPVQVIVIEDACLFEKLAPFDPDETIVFNWCEELPDVPYSEAQPAHILDERGFTFTGAGSKALALAIDKHRVKLLLDE